MSLRAITIAVTAFSLALGCDAKKPPAPASEPAARPEASLDRRDQYALLADIEEVQAAPAAEQARRYADLRNAWLGRRVAWELSFLPVLCRTPEQCLAVPFDHKKRESRIVQGWLPRLVVDEKTHAALGEACKPHGVCVVQIEAKLSRLTASTELPTSLDLGDVKVVAARAARPEESWGRSTGVAGRS